ncbi:hypothetical protein MKX03_027604 [Papaver bracteatum]|nr:hypothetical protein MKX03_027604 [Papaver bracteatum]
MDDNKPFILTSISFQVAVFFTIFCILFGAFWFNKEKTRRKKKCCDCDSSKKISVEEEEEEEEEEGYKRYLNGGGEMPVRVTEGGGSVSMMEQLVPEITTHALSYLDYPSLCRLSMTNSSMRKAANDDSAWKMLYHKDFTAEQDSVMPVNGWKAYYAATRAIMNINAEFFNIIRDRSITGMGAFWLNADYVKCIHTSGEVFSGYDAVMESWQLTFNWGQGVAFQIRDVKTRVFTDIAWVTMKTYVDDPNSGPFNVTNVYEFHKGQWYLVHHHCSVILIGAEADQQNLFG